MLNEDINRCTNAIGVAADTFFRLYMGDLSKELKDKYLKGVEIYSENKAVAEDKVSKVRQKAKNEIDLRMEKVKAQLESIRDELYKDVDSFCDNALEKMHLKVKHFDVFKGKADELKEINETNLEKEKFHKIQKSSKDMIEKMQESFDFNLNVTFKESDFMLSDKAQFGSLICNTESIVEKLPSKDDIQITRIESDEPNVVKQDSVRLPKCLLASSSYDKTVKIWDLEKKECIQTLKGHTGYTYPLQTLKYGLLASGSDDATIKIWDSNSGSCISTLTGHQNTVYSLVLLDENTLASGGIGKTIKLWDIEQKALIRIFENTDSILCLERIEANLLASSGENKRIQVWDVQNKKCIYELEGHEDALNDLKTIESNFVSSCSYDGTIRFWDLRSKSCVINIDRIGDSLGVYSIAPVKQDIIAVAYEDSKIRLWDYKSGKLIDELIGHTDVVRSFTMLDANTLASCSSDKTVKIWNINTKKCIHTFTGHDSWVYRLAKVI